GLIQTFSEESSDTPPVIAGGLFTTLGTPPTAIPTAMDLTGLAGEIRLHPAVDPALGGDAEKLRDGAHFNFNPNGHASFNELLHNYIDRLDAQADFVGAGGAVKQSLKAYSAATVSWLEDARKTASGAAETRAAL